MTRIVNIAAVILMAASISLVAQQPARDGRVIGQVGTAIVTGQVVNDSNAQPVRRAIVTLSGGDLVTSRTAISDDDGKFALRNLPPGRFTITATKAGFVSTSYGSPRAGRPGTALSVTAGQQAVIALRMAPGAVITGVIRDEHSQAVPNISVGASSTSMQIDRWFQSSEFALTDDRGVYRIYGLMPGEYVVAAVPAQTSSGDIGRRSESDVDAAFAVMRVEAGRSLSGMAPPAPGAPSKPLDPALAPPKSHSFAPSYFPGTALYTNAARVRLTAGEERSGVDFSLGTVPVATLTGAVLRPDGQSAVTVELSIIIDGPKVSAARLSLNSATSPILSSPPDAQGAFKYSNILPGHYTVIARVSPSAQPTSDQLSGRIGGGSGGGSSGGTFIPIAAGDLLFGVAEIDATGSDISGVSIVLQRGATMTGRVVFDATTAAVPADITTTRLNISPPGGTNYIRSGNTTTGNAFRSTQPAQVSADGTFIIKNIAPGLYIPAITPPPGSAPAWWLRSVMVGGKDLLDVPLEFGIGGDMRDVVVTFSDRRATLEGSLTAPGARPAMDYYVAVFPTDRAMWQPGARRVKSTRPASDGAFSLKDLPPGEYYLAALTDLDASDWNDPAFYDALIPASIKITIGEGERKKQDLKIGG